MNIVDLFNEQGEHRPKSVAIIDRHRNKDRATSFAQLDSYSAAYAYDLRRGGEVCFFAEIHRAEAELRYLQSGFAKQAIVHRLGSCHVGGRGLRKGNRTRLPRRVKTVRVLRRSRCRCREAKLRVKEGMLRKGKAHVP